MEEVITLVSYEELLRKVSRRDLTIAVFGQGYVGLPLALSFACAGLNTIGIDVSPELVKKLNCGQCTTSDPCVSEKLSLALTSGKYIATTDGIDACRKADIGIICVQTPIKPNYEPDLTYVFQAIYTFLQSFRKGKLLIIESSLPPGSMENEIVPLIRQKGITVGRDMGLAYCPERINPGDKKWNLANIPRVMAASDMGTRHVVSELYKYIVSATQHFVSNFKTAEVVKSFENAFRFVNISLVNELAVFCNRFGVDVREVIDAASTKPFGFLPHYPSAGIGGHCLPKDSAYLYNSAMKKGSPLRILHSAIQVNKRMPIYFAHLIAKTMDELGIEKSEGSILVIGLSYKEDMDDIRDSPGLKIAKHLAKAGYKVVICEPTITAARLRSLGFKYIKNPATKDLRDVVGICIVQYHSVIMDKIYEVIEDGSVKFIVDCKNMLPQATNKNIKIIRHGSDKV